MRQFIIAESEADFTSHAGLGLIGLALERYTDLTTDAAAIAPLRCDAIGHRDVLSCYVAMLCLGKSDLEAISGFREDEFFHEALGLTQIPSEGTLRQRMDAHAEAFRPLVETAAVAFVRNVGAPITPLANGLVPLDCDVIPFDNGKTRKEGVSRTSKGCDGFAPMAAYLGQEGWCLELEMREGSQHCQKGTPEFLQRVVARARSLTQRGVLLRLDGGQRPSTTSPWSKRTTSSTPTPCRCATSSNGTRARKAASSGSPMPKTTPSGPSHAPESAWPPSTSSSTARTPTMRRLFAASCA